MLSPARSLTAAVLCLAFAGGANAGPVQFGAKATVAMCVSLDNQHRRYNFAAKPNSACIYGGYFYLPGTLNYTGTIRHFPPGTTEK